jgi:nucleoside-diphosphate-sugar epimerase
VNVLVTGATGFVGGRLVDHLLARGDTVTALVRSPDRAAPLSERGVRLIAGDLANHDALATAVTGQDVIYHVAGLVGAIDEAEFMAANRDGTANVARAARDAAVRPRFVLISSMAAGGPSRRGMPKTADGLNAPVTAYGRSKLAGESALTAIIPDAVIVRPPVVYGPGDRDGLLPLFKAARYGIAPMLGDGTMEISLIHVADLADAIILAATTADLCGVYYVNHPAPTTSAELARAVAREMQQRPLLLRVPRWLAVVILAITGAWSRVMHQKTILHPDKIHEFFQEAWTADPSPFMARTGWSAVWDLPRGLADTAAWYRNAHWL